MKKNKYLRKESLLDLHLKAMTVNNFYTRKSFDNENLFYQQYPGYNDILAYRLARDIIDKSRGSKK